MRLRTLSATVAACLALHTSTGHAKQSHLHPNILDLRHHHHRRENYTAEAKNEGSLELRAAVDVERRGGQCDFPTNVGLLPVTPDDKNGGWAMSPDQVCTTDSYCPYACPPGQLMAQWDPKATSYTYPQSMVGVLSLPTRLQLLTVPRTEAYIVTRMEMCRNLFPISRIAWEDPRTLRLSTRSARRYPSARRYYQEMRPC